MSRLPTPGKDSGSWGNLLNEFLLTAHHIDGSHKLDTDSILAANSDTRIASQRAVKAYIDKRVTNNPTPDATDGQKGKLRLAGDLAGDANAPAVKSRTTTTVGLLSSDYRYDSGMVPLHYADATNSALAGSADGEVFLRGETVNFVQSAGKVIVPTSYVHIKGAGADKTVIRTSRTDYVLKNTTNLLMRARLSDLTIDCQNIPNVSGIDIRKFSHYYLGHTKFQNSSQWFARFGNEPSGVTNDMNTDLIVEDCEFTTHEGIYEMLLIYNTDLADIHRCTFTGKTGSPGAAPTIGIWQKANNVTIRNSIFSNLVSSAIYYAYTTNRLFIQNCSFINTGQAIRGANVSDNGRFGEKHVQGLVVDNCRILGGANSASADAIQIGSVNGFWITNTFIADYGKGIRIGFGNSTPSAGGDGGDAHFPSRYGIIQNVRFERINSGGGATTLNSPLYFTNGGDFGQLIIKNCVVVDPNDHLDYAVIFNGGSTATASILAGVIASVTVAATFAWYATAPAVIISGNGSGANATAIIDSDGRLTDIHITDGGSGYTSATVTVDGAHYKNITFVDCDFGGKQIRTNDLVQIDWASVQFINCRNFDTANLSAAVVDQCVRNTNRTVMHDGKIGIGAASLAASTDFQVGDGSAVVTTRLNNVQEKNSNDNIQKIFANFVGKTETFYKNNTNTTNRRSVFDVDTGTYTSNGFDANLGTDMTTGGLVAKRLTTAQRDSLTTPANGTIIYNASINKLQAYENSAWANLI